MLPIPPVDSVAAPPRVAPSGAPSMRLPGCRRTSSGPKNRFARKVSLNLLSSLLETTKREITSKWQLESTSLKESLRAMEAQMSRLEEKLSSIEDAGLGSEEFMGNGDRDDPAADTELSGNAGKTGEEPLSVTKSEIMELIEQEKQALASERRSATISSSSSSSVPEAELGVLEVTSSLPVSVPKKWRAGKRGAVARSTRRLGKGSSRKNKAEASANSTSEKTARQRDTYNRRRRDAQGKRNAVGSRRRHKTGSSRSSGSSRLRMRNLARQKSDRQPSPPTLDSLSASVGDIDSTAIEAQLRIRELEHQVSLLRTKHSQLQAKYHHDVSAADEKALAYGKQVDNLVSQVEHLVARNADTAAQKTEAEIRSQEYLSRVNHLEMSSGTLRNLVLEFLSNPSEQKLRSMEEVRFWDQFATPEIISKSRPPQDFKVANTVGSGPIAFLQAHPVHVQELEATRTRLNALERENRKLRTKLENLQQETLTSRSKHAAKHTQAQALIAKQQKWLMGTVRRIKWVLKKRGELEETLKQRSKYISKLESKLLHQAMVIRKQRQRQRNTKSQRNAIRQQQRSAMTAKVISRQAAAKTTPSSRSRVEKIDATPDSDSPDMMSPAPEALSTARGSRRARAKDIVADISSQDRAEREGMDSPRLRSSLASILRDEDAVPSPGPSTSPLRSPAPNGPPRGGDVAVEMDSIFDGLLEKEFDQDDIESFASKVSRELQKDLVEIYKDDERRVTREDE